MVKTELKKQKKSKEDSSIYRPHTRTSSKAKAVRGHMNMKTSSAVTEVKIDGQVLPSKTVSLALVLISPTLLVAVHS